MHSVAAWATLMQGDPSQITKLQISLWMVTSDQLMGAVGIFSGSIIIELVDL